MTKSNSGPGGFPLHVQVAGSERIWRFERSFSIGRSDENDVAIPDALVSQRHAEVVAADGEWRIRDLGSTNGTFIDGKPVQDAVIRPPVDIRFGYSGPILHLRLPSSAVAARETVAAPQPRGTAIAERYLGDHAPSDMGEQTAKIRRMVAEERRQRTRKYRFAVGILAVVAVATGGYGYWQHRQAVRQRAAAVELFYAAKALELEVSRLQLTAEERQSYRERRAEMERQYQEFVKALGIYSDRTSEETKLVYRVIHRFGESEVNAPPEFVDEVLRYVERWKRSGELKGAIARADSLGYGRRVAQIMLEHDLPPEFFYLALQESRLKCEAVGPETRFGIAKGMWQFLPATGRAYGLQPGPLVGQPRPDPLDDRQDFDKATTAAARYLYDIYTTDAQASGLLVIASYNWGQTNVLRLIRSMPESPRERNFWNLLTQYQGRIPRETYGYVFNIVAAAVIGENPGLFGFDFAPPLPSDGPQQAAASGD